MANGNTVMFRGVDRVIEAYEYNKVPSWSIACGREVPFTYEGDSIVEGADTLRQCLEMLKESGTESTFVLRVYKEVKGQIMSNTPYKNSFPFKLWDEEDTGAYTGPRNMRYHLEGRIAKLEKELEESKAALPETEHSTGIVNGIQGMLAGILERKEVQDLLVGRVIGIVDNVCSMFGIKRPAAVAGVPADHPKTGSTDEAYKAMSEEERVKLNEAMSILLTHDPQLGTNLYKLACILRDSPAKYKMYASML